MRVNTHDIGIITSSDCQFCKNNSSPTTPKNIIAISHVPNNIPNALQGYNRYLTCTRPSTNDKLNDPPLNGLKNKFGIPAKYNLLRKLSSFHPAVDVAIPSLSKSDCNAPRATARLMRPLTLTAPSTRKNGIRKFNEEVPLSALTIAYAGCPYANAAHDVCKDTDQLYNGEAFRKWSLA